jgi:hypothetical protein
MGRIATISSKPTKTYIHYSPISFVASLKPPPFKVINYTRWRARAIIWLTTMSCFDVTKGNPEGELTPVEERMFSGMPTPF